MNQEVQFIAYLQSLSSNNNTRVLGILRRGLGQPPGLSPGMLQFVAPGLPAAASPGSWLEKSHYLIASLFAFHPANTPNGNLGHHFARLFHPDQATSMILEMRFNHLLSIHPNDLYIYLPQAVGYLKVNKQVPINWQELLRDVIALGDHQNVQEVKRRWTHAFWDARLHNTPSAHSDK